LGLGLRAEFAFLCCFMHLATTPSAAALRPCTAWDAYDRVGGRNNALPVMLLYIFGAKAHASPRTDVGWWSLHFAGVRVRGCRCSLTPGLSFDVILHKPIQRSASKRRAALTDRDSIVLGRRQTTKFTASSERPVRGYHMVWAMPVLAVLSQTPGTRLQPAGYPPPLTSTV
jgi:hypothetical protein